MINNDTEFKIALKLASMMALDDMTAEYDDLDLSDVVVNEKTARKIRRASRMARLKESCIALSLNKVAVAVLLAGTILFTAMMCIQPVRAALWETIVTWYEDFVGMIFEAPDEYPKIIEKVKIPEVPDGWNIEKMDEDKISVTYILTGSDDEFIMYQQMVYTNDEIWVDNTGCSINEIELENGTKAQLYSYEDGRYHIYWVNDYVFSIMGENITSEMLIKMANNINQE